jgi:hypothetical protein
MRHVTSDDTTKMKPVMISGMRTMALIVIWTLIALSAMMCPGTMLVAWAGPEEPIPAGPPPGAPGGQPAPSYLSSPLEGKEPPASLQQDEEKQAAPSLSVQPLTVPTATSSAVPAASSVSANEDRMFVDELHGGISKGFLTSATWLDSFFGDERYEAEVNRSYFKVRFDAFREGSGGMDYQRPNFDLRLVLPRLRQKTRLVISGDPNEDLDTTASQPVTPASQGPARSVTSALQFFPLDTKRSNLSIRAGVKFHNMNLSFSWDPGTGISCIMKTGTCGSPRKSCGQRTLDGRSGAGSTWSGLFPETCSSGRASKVYGPRTCTVIPMP